MIAHLAIWLVACGSAPDTHAHDDHAHDDAAAEANAGPVEAAMGVYTVRLEPGEASLKLVVVDAEGQAVPAEGQAQVLLTGTGEAPQRVLLAADGNAWSGEARAAGAAGYVAVMRVPVKGNLESARLTWGEVPEQEAAPQPADHDHGKDGHDHGDDADHHH